MVSHPADYPWSDHRYNALGKTNTSITPHDCWLLQDEDDSARREAYRGLFQVGLDQMDLEHIRHSINTGLPTGNDRFRREIEQALSIRLGQGKRGRPSKNQGKKKKCIQPL